MRIIRYPKGHIGALVLIVALLVIQAFADLSLPRYTSDLVDVGIQQGGGRPSIPVRIHRGYVRRRLHACFAR